MKVTYSYLILFSFLLCHCTITNDVNSMGSGSISGGTVVDNPTPHGISMKQSTIIATIDTNHTLPDIQLFLSSNPTEVVQTTTVKTDGSFIFTAIPFGTYDIVSKDSTIGALYRNITITNDLPDYHIDSLSFYPLTEITIDVGNKNVVSLQFYNETITANDNGIYIFKAIDILTDRFIDSTKTEKQELLLTEEINGEHITSTIDINSPTQEILINTAGNTPIGICAELPGINYVTKDSIITLGLHPNGNTILVERHRSQYRVFVSNGDTLKNVTFSESEYSSSENLGYYFDGLLGATDINKNHISFSAERNATEPIVVCSAPEMLSDGPLGECVELSPLSVSAIDSLQFSNYTANPYIRFAARDGDSYIIIAMRYTLTDELTTLHYGPKGALVKREITNIVFASDDKIEITFEVDSREVQIRIPTSTVVRGSERLSLNLTEESISRNIEWLILTDSIMQSIGFNCDFDIQYQNPTVLPRNSLTDYWETVVAGGVSVDSIVVAYAEFNKFNGHTIIDSLTAEEELRGDSVLLHVAVHSNEYEWHEAYTGLWGGPDIDIDYGTDYNDSLSNITVCIKNDSLNCSENNIDTSIRSFIPTSELNSNKNFGYYTYSRTEFLEKNNYKNPSSFAMKIDSRELSGMLSFVVTLTFNNKEFTRETIIKPIIH